jgi:hypothetical protein
MQEQIIRKLDKLVTQLPEGRDILRGSLLDRAIHPVTAGKKRRGK